MPKQSLDEWLSLLENRHPVKIDLGLDRIGRVAQQLGLGRPAARVITVAGTNGKGSCVSALQSMLLAAGFRVGSYTSPHLVRYNERISINGAAVTDELICGAFDQIEAARDDISLSYFEFGTLAALLLMARNALDFAILEVGLGGRLDAVNMVDANIAIVTSIALDHQDWLGDDLDFIAGEKAAIARQGRPLIFGGSSPLPGLQKAAADIGARLLLMDREFNLDQAGSTIAAKCLGQDGITIQYHDLPATRLPLPSVACALQALTWLCGELPSEVVALGLSGANPPGRFQLLRYRGIEIILDVAHNPAAAEFLASRLAGRSNSNIRAVVGLMADKDIAGILYPMKQLVHTWYLTEIPAMNRAAGCQEIAAVLYNADDLKDDKICQSSSPQGAFERALDGAEKGDLVVVFGSFYIVGPILEWLASKGVVL